MLLFLAVYTENVNVQKLQAITKTTYNHLEYKFMMIWYEYDVIFATNWN